MGVLGFLQIKGACGYNRDLSGESLHVEAAEGAEVDGNCIASNAQAKGLMKRPERAFLTGER